MELFQIYVIDKQPVIAKNLEEAINTFRVANKIVGDIHNVELLFGGCYAYLDYELHKNK